MAAHPLGSQPILDDDALGGAGGAKAKAAKSDALTVTEAMTAAKRALEGVRITVIGEVSEFSDKPGYKAAYFTVSDGSAAMPCLMWRGRYEQSGVVLRQGMMVEMRGYFSAYVPKGRMQFTCDSLSLAGEGDLRMRVAQLAAKLEAEGLMSPLRKQPLPAMPRRIAVVTSPRGKAIHDVMRTLRRRYPVAELLIAGVTVEGENAPLAIVEGMGAAIDAEPDVILLVRGGGSYEDLMPFNSEMVARVVAGSTIPVVTGIGHEPDTTIADMVSDLRASTPTAAAEAATPSFAELEGQIVAQERLLANALQRYLTTQKHRVERLASRPVLMDARMIFSAQAQAVDMLGMNLKREGETLTRRFENSISMAAARLHDLSPLAILGRGYAIARNKNTKEVVRSVDAVRPGDTVTVTIADGELEAMVTDKRKREQ